jgi:MFS transporter, DHA3 family, macrolide efflux protein
MSAPRLRPASPWGGFLHQLIATVISALGSHLTGFALGVWIYRSTGSTSQYALLGLCGLLPCVLAWPLAGAIADRIGPDRALVIGQLGAGTSILSVAVAAWSGEPSLVHVLVAFAVGSLFESLEYPSLSASLTLRVAPAQLPRASALAEVGQVVAQLLAPTLGALLLGAGGLGAVLGVDLVTFALGLLVLLGAPRGPARVRPAVREASHWSELLAGWRWISGQRALLALCGLGALANFAAGFVQVLATPLVLGFADETSLGLVLSIAAAGMVIGSVLVILRPAPARPARLAAILLAVQGALLGFGIVPSVPMIAAATFGFGVASAAQAALMRVLWQRLVPVEVSARVAALRATLTWLPLPLAHSLAGPLVDGVFDPLVALAAPGTGEDAGLLAALGELVGHSAGRGSALLLLALALALVPIALLCLRSTWLPQLDRDARAAATLDDVSDAAPAPEVSR